MKANCPICDVGLNLSKDLMESEVFECDDCHRRIVVKSMNKAENKIILEEAPAVEEDWGQ